MVHGMIKGIDNFSGELDGDGTDDDDVECVAARAFTPIHMSNSAEESTFSRKLAFNEGRGPFHARRYRQNPT